jgi:hypothetical protein
MSEQQTLFLWMLTSGSFGAALGAAFGAGVGAITWLNGRAAGTFIGLGLARAYERVAECKLTPGKKGALIGGTDGAVFVGAMGALVGAMVAWSIPTAGEVLGPAAVAVTVLVGAGALFGLMAFALLRTGVRAVGPLFIGSMLGASIGWYLWKSNGLLAGLVVGLVAGTAVAFLLGPPRS